MPTKLSRLRSRAFKRQGGRCYYCHALMWQSRPATFATAHRITLAQARRFQCTAEHLQARQDSGRDIRDNIVAACRHCNALRHRRPSTTCSKRYKAVVRRRLTKRRWHPAWVFERGICPTSR